MKKFLIPMLLLSMTAVFTGCGTKEADLPNNINDQPTMEEVQEIATPEGTMVDDTIVEQPQENVAN